MKESRLIKALRGENRGRPPVWLMRQAGRYLPEYRELRKNHSLKELFFTPALAAQITRMPIDRFGLDAAILFSDITVVAEAMGLPLEFQEGPIVAPWQEKDLRDCPEALDPIIDAVLLLKKDLAVPLIGFCGGPFTVATYLLGGVERALQYTRLSSLLDRIADVSCEYLRRQAEAGANALQIFDSWANVLTPEQFRTWSLPYIERLIAAANVPPIFFMRGAGRHLEEIPCAVSLDWETDLAAARLKTKRALQGNLNPDLLFEPLPVIREKTMEILKSMKGDPAFVLNLGHGVKPGTPVEAVHSLVETVISKGEVV
jgi:uroporphyrinogen decarboxylase